MSRQRRALPGFFVYTIFIELPDITFKKSRKSRSMRISIRRDGECVVSVPWYVPKIMADRFVQKHAEWIADQVGKVKSRPKPIVERGNRKQYEEYKEKARTLAKERLEHFNKFYGFNYGRITIRNQKTRWGSCSKKGNLNFSYRIALLPAHLADYIIVHELCHIGQFNHSKDFWDLVGKMVPDYETCRNELRA